MKLYRFSAGVIAAVLILCSCMTTAYKQDTGPQQQAEAAAGTAIETPEAAEPGGFEKPSAARLKELDAHAAAAGEQLKDSVENLAAYLVQPCDTDYAKARVIFSWIAFNIAYDTDAFFSGIQRPQNGESVLSTGTAVCAGYSDVFSMLAEASGIEARTVNGHGKGYGYRRGQPVEQNHAWTAVNTEAGWILIDTTWGAGWVGDDRKFHREFSGYWFDVEPEVMIFTHFPENIADSLTVHKWTAAEYAALPNLKPDVFAGEINPDLAAELASSLGPGKAEEILQKVPDFISMGFNPAMLAGELRKKDFPGFAGVFAPPGGRKLKAINMPAAGILPRGGKAVFEYRIDDCLKHALIYEGEWHFALRDGEPDYNFAGVYDGTIAEDGTVRFEIDCSKAGNIKITAQPGEHDSFGAFIEYEVR